MTLYFAANFHCIMNCFNVVMHPSAWIIARSVSEQVVIKSHIRQPLVILLNMYCVFYIIFVTFKIMYLLMSLYDLSECTQAMLHNKTKDSESLAL